MRVDKSTARAIAGLLARDASLSGPTAEALARICVEGNAPGWQVAPEPGEFDWGALVEASVLLERAGIEVTRDAAQQRLGAEPYASVLGMLLAGVIGADAEEGDVLRRLVGKPNRLVKGAFPETALYGLRQRLRTRFGADVDVHGLAPLGARLVVVGNARKRGSTVESVVTAKRDLQAFEAGGLRFELAKPRVTRGAASLQLSDQQYDRLLVLASTGHLAPNPRDANAGRQLRRLAELVHGAFDDVRLAAEPTWRISVAGAVPTPEPSWQLGAVSFRPLAREARWSGVTVTLTRRQAALFALLAYFENELIGHAQLMEALETVTGGMRRVLGELREALPIPDEQLQIYPGHVRLLLPLGAA